MELDVVPGAGRAGFRYAFDDRVEAYVDTGPAWVVAGAPIAREDGARRALAWWLGRSLALAVTLDAIVTWAEALLWNAPRARTPVDWLVTAVACAAPSVAALILWGAVRHREWMRGGAPLVRAA